MDTYSSCESGENNQNQHKKTLSINKTKIVVFDSMHLYRNVDQYCDKICKLLNYEWVRLKKHKQTKNRVPFDNRKIIVLYPEGKNGFGIL